MSANVETNNARLGSTPVRYTLVTASPVTVSSSGSVTAGSIRVTAVATLAPSRHMIAEIQVIPRPTIATSMWTPPSPSSTGGPRIDDLVRKFRK